MKQTFNTAQSAFTPTKVEYYIRDASGNIMTTYMQNNDLATNNCNIAVDEQPIYGSARLGTAHYYAVKSAGTIGGIKNDIFAPINFVLSERLPAYSQASEINRIV